MTTILIKKKDTAGAPAPGDLTNAAGGTEIAVNTATRRIYTKDSGGNVVELGNNATSSTIADLTVTTSTTLSYGTANQVQYLNASKLLVGSASMTFNGTTLTAGGLTTTGTTSTGVLSVTGNTTLGDASADTVTVNGTITSNLLFTDNTYDIGPSGANRPRNLFVSNRASVGTTGNGYGLNVGGGVNVVNAATLPAAQGSMVLTFDNPVNRIIMGDGSGYSFTLSTRGASTTTDLMTLSDSGLFGFGAAPVAATRMYIRGTGATSASFSLYIDDSASSNTFFLRNNGAAYFKGNTGIGITDTFGARLAVLGGALPTSSAGVAISSQLTAGRLTTGNTNATTGYIGNFLDDSITELSAGSSGNLTSGIVAFGGNAVVNPNSVRTYTGGTVRTTTDVNGLTVVGSAAVSNSAGAGALQLGTASGRTQYQYTTYGGAIGGTDYGWQVGRSPTAGIVADGFYIYDIKGSLTRLAIDIDGRVGIGTTVPLKFNTSGSASARLLTLYSTGTNSGTRAEFQIGNVATGAGEITGLIMFGCGASTATLNQTAIIYSSVTATSTTTATGNLVFGTANGSGTIERGNFAANGLFTATYGSYSEPSLGSIAGGLGLNILNSATWNDNSLHAINSVQDVMGAIHIRAGGLSSVAFYPNGGGGVAYGWTVLNPQTGTWTAAQGPTIIFTDFTSNPNTYTITFSGGSGVVNIQRTAGTKAYVVLLQVLATS